MSNNWNDPNAPQGNNSWQGEHAGDQNPQHATGQDWNASTSGSESHQGYQAPQGDWGQSGQQGAHDTWNQDQSHQSQGWDQGATSSSQQGYEAPTGGWDQHQQGSQGYGTQGSWDQNQAHQAQGTQNWDQNQQGSQGYGTQGGWDQNQANQGWDQNQQGYGTQGGWDQNTGAGYGSPIPAAGMGPAGLPLATWPKRALGALVDIVVPLFILNLITSALTGGFSTETTDTSASFNSQNNAIGLITWAVLSLILAALNGKTGQTPGRKIAKTQLVDMEGRPLGFGKLFVRYMAHYIDSFICCIGWLFPLWDKQRQTIADKLVKSYVVDVSHSGPINVQH